MNAGRKGQGLASSSLSAVVGYNLYVTTVGCPTVPSPKDDPSAQKKKKKVRGAAQDPVLPFHSSDASTADRPTLEYSKSFHAQNFSPANMFG